MRAIIEHVVARENCPKCGKEIETTDFMDLVCDMVQSDIDECPHCGVYLGDIDKPEDYEEEEEEDDE